jgi:hypothetical protein
MYSRRSRENAPAAAPHKPLLLVWAFWTFVFIETGATDHLPSPRPSHELRWSLFLFLSKLNSWRRCYPDAMSQPGSLRSPFQEGFAALREEPLLLLAELTWRWCFGIAAWILVLGAAAMFLDSLTIAPADQFLLGTFRPALAWIALTHVVQGSLLRYLWTKFIVLAGLTLLWCLASAVGRAASLRNLVALFGGDDLAEDEGWQFRPMLQLHLTRALWTWIAIGCYAGSILLGAAMLHQQRAARAAFFYVFGVALSIFFGVVLNWFFGLAPLFCIRKGANTRDALWLTFEFCSRHGGRLFGLSAGFLALRLAWAGSMFFLVLAPTSLAKHIAFGWVLLIMGLLFLIYLAGADALHLARLGAYAALAEIDAQPTPKPSPEPEPAPDPAPPVIPIEETPGLQPA